MRTRTPIDIEDVVKGPYRVFSLQKSSRGTLGVQFKWVMTTLAVEYGQFSYVADS